MLDVRAKGVDRGRAEREGRRRSCVEAFMLLVERVLMK